MEIPVIFVFLCIFMEFLRDDGRMVAFGPAELFYFMPFSPRSLGSGRQQKKKAE